MGLIISVLNSHTFSEKLVETWYKIWHKIYQKTNTICNTYICHSWAQGF